MMVRLHAFTYVELNLDSPWLYCSIESFLQTHTYARTHRLAHSYVTHAYIHTFIHTFIHTHTHSYCWPLYHTGKGTGIYVWFEDNSTQFLHFISLHFQYNVAGTQSL